MKIIVIALTILFIVLQYQLWFSKGSLLSAWRMRRNVEKQTIINAVLKKRNDRLNSEINDLKHRKQAVEEHARNDLGMIKRNETFYQVVKKSDDNHS